MKTVTLMLALPLLTPAMAGPTQAAQPGPASTVHLQVLLSGSPVGSNDWTRSPDGSFKGRTELNVASISIANEINGHFEGAHLVDANVDGKRPQGPLKITYANGQMTTVTGGKTTTEKFAPKDDLYAGNLIPELWGASLDMAYARLKSSEGRSVTMSSFLLEVGAEVPVDYKLLPAKTVKVQGVDKVARRFQLSIRTLQMELDQDASGNIVAMDVPSQKIRMLATGWDGLFVDPLAAYPELSQPTLTIKKLLNEKVAMRDGVQLATDLVMPSADGQYPAILIRTPYGRAAEDLAGDFYAKRGYVLVCQDCRGRGDSDGEWDPFVHEGNDGFDTIAWIAKQPWSSGKVGMIGGSYVGYVQWAAAVTRPPALKCIVPQVSPPDAMHNLPYDFGIPFLYGDVWWARVVAGKNADMLSVLNPLPHPKGLAVLPLSKADKAALGQTVPFYQTWLKRTEEKDWKGWDFLSHMDQADLPALHISGWWDGDGIGTKLNWAAERRLGRKNQWLIYGPWPHAFNSSSSIGKVNFGPTAILELDSLYLRWFDTWLKGKSVGMDKVPHVRAFVTGANKWVDLSDWPDSTEKAKTLYLAKNSLVAKPQEGEGSFTYDPANDTETKALEKGAAAADDFTGELKLANEKQPYLLFKTAPLTKDTAIAGPATIDVYFKSSARDTDWFGLLVDVDPSGRVFDIGQPGKIRASYRNGMNGPTPLTPGRTYHVQLLPWDFAHEVKKGHRIGLLLLPTGFPAYARNLGTAEPPATATRIVAQHNTVLFGASNPSRVTFQVIWER